MIGKAVPVMCLFPIVSCCTAAGIARNVGAGCEVGSNATTDNLELFWMTTSCVSCTSLLFGAVRARRVATGRPVY